MTSINQDQPLIRTDQLRLEITSFNKVIVQHRDVRVTCSAHGLRILDLFATPISFRDALAKLQEGVLGAQDAIQLTTDIINLARSGILHPPDHRPVALPTDGYHFNTIYAHAEMLNDHTRTRGFIQAIHQVVRSGDVVVDIGTGSGVLAVAAAQAGAKHVYAIDTGMIGEIARQVFAANGLEDRITFIRGMSSQIELPERADVLVSEIIGREPLGEGILQTFRDAWKRLLRPDARCIPQYLAIYALPIAFPPDYRPRSIITEQSLKTWEAWYRMDLRPLKQAQQQPLTFQVSPKLLRNYIALSEPVCLAEIDLADIQTFVVEAEIDVLAVRDGRIDGVFVFFEAQLSKNHRLSTSPYRVDSSNHWEHLVWVLPHPVEVEEGRAFRLRYLYDPGMQTQVSVKS